MAENPKYLPSSVVGPATGSNTAPYYYVYDYNGTDINAAGKQQPITGYLWCFYTIGLQLWQSQTAVQPIQVECKVFAHWLALAHTAEWRQLIDYLGGI